VQKLADLHIHTTASDGSLRPEEAVKLAKKAKLFAIAICDHDSVDGISPAIEAGKLYRIRVIPGVEMCYENGPIDAHIVGYFIDWQDKTLNSELRELQQGRFRRVNDILEKLSKAGVELKMGDVLSVAAEGAVLTRSHVARAMVIHGYSKSEEEAFEKFLAYGRGAYVNRYQLPLGETMRLIKNAGGVPVLAHPKHGEATRLLPELVDLGLKGIEVYHPDHSKSDIARFRRLARKYGLIEVGGSDSHGPDRPIGTVTVPYEVVERLEEARE
jgi:predicted metal-dependent phosphoesterase TrpH